MTSRLRWLCLPLLVWSGSAVARDIVDASEAVATSVTVYRDPNRGPGQQIDRGWPRGFAMISEERDVTLPPGESTIRFTGVAEGMVAVSAIVTGLPGGTIEKNRNADLLSPAALVDGTLGNRVTITRTNPGTGEEVSERAIIRTRADGGLVLETPDGYEAVRCSGLPERLSFDRVPDGLSPEPVFSIDTSDRTGGTYRVTLTYLAWGFDWQANYVATLREGGASDDLTLRLMSWLTILNDNNQTFEDAELLAVAGTLNVVSDFEDLAEPPRARPLALTCYPLGSTARGSPFGQLNRLPQFSPPPPPAPPPSPMAAMRMEMADESIIVTGSRVYKAEEEALGDLKLYRIPQQVNVSAQSLKQVAFLDEDRVRGRLLYRETCAPWSMADEARPAQMLFVTKNDEEHGLGMALPSGAIAFFEPSSAGELLVGEQTLRDYAEGQDVEIEVGSSAQVFLTCEDLVGETGAKPGRWRAMQASVTNANPEPIDIRLVLGPPSQFDHRGLRTTLKDGERIVEVRVPANGTRTIKWDIREAAVN